MFEGKEKKHHNNNNKKTKKQKHTHDPTPDMPKPSPDISFKPAHDVKGLKFGAQKLIVKSFTVRRCRAHELPHLLNLHSLSSTSLLPSTVAYIPTNFTILAHHAWNTLTLGLGTKKSKIIIFVFSTKEAKATTADLTWPNEVPLGEVNKRLIKGLNGWEMARFKFRKGCVTFYVFGVRRVGERGFVCGDELRSVLRCVVSLKDFLDHTAMLAMPGQRSIDFQNNNNNVANATSSAACHHHHGGGAVAAH